MSSQNLLEVLDWVCYFLQAIQEGSLAFVESIGFSASFFDFLTVLTYFRLNFLNVGYLTVFFILAGGTSGIQSTKEADMIIYFNEVTERRKTNAMCHSVYVILSIALTCLEVDLCEGVLDEYLWFWIGQSLIFGHLLIPTSRSIIEMFNCPDGRLFKAPDVECWQGLHIFYIVIACFAGLTILIGALIKFSGRNDESHSSTSRQRMRHSVQYYDAGYFIYRLVLVCLSVSLASTTSSGGQTVIALCFTLISLLPLAFLFQKLPHIEARYNALKALTYALISWSFLCTFVEVNAQNAGAWMMLGYPLVSIIAFKFAVMRSKSTPPTSEDLMAIDLSGKVSDPFVNPVVRSYLHKYKVEPNRAAVIHYQDSESFQQFIQQCSTRDNLQIIIVMRKGDRGSDATQGSVSNADIHLLTEIVPNNLSLRVFAVSGHRLIGAPAQALLDVLNGHPSLEVVDLYDNCVDFEAAKFITKGLMETPNLKTINLGESEVDSEGRMEIQRLLEELKAPYKVLF